VTGASGPTGPIGPCGPKGSPGPQGATGPAGPNAITPTFVQQFINELAINTALQQAIRDAINS
jgi:hypothetical protein